MNDTYQSELCGCDSGLNYSDCCGVFGRQAVNADIMLRLDEHGQITHGTPTPQLQAALDTIHHNPELFLARINIADGKAWFVKMSPKWYQESVFLDPVRIKGTYVVETVLPWLQTVCDRIPWQPTSYIFHTAFCGSTLLAQALETLYQSLSLREPETLGNIQYYLHNAAVPEQQRKGLFDQVMRLMSRRYDPRQRIVVKANDFANPVMIDLLQRQPSVPILFMYTPLNEFVAGCVKADSRREWILERYRAIHYSLPAVLGLDDIPIPETTAYGEMAAIYWSYNIALLQKAMTLNPDQLRTLNFNQILEQPLSAVRACGEFLGLEPLDDIDTQAAIDSLFGTYSKDNNYRYSPLQRAQDIDRALSKNKDHLEQAEAMVRRLLGDTYPPEVLPGSLI